MGTLPNIDLVINSTTLPTSTSTFVINSLNTTNSNESCQHYDELIEKWFQFDSYFLTRVLITWTLFILSATGNIFVLVSLRAMKRQHHFIMFHLALADLTYACFVLTTDAIWNTTMQWYGGNVTCKLAQMLKQFGMYASSYMVVTIGVDRVTAILSPATAARQRKLGVILVTAAWITSGLSTIPAGIIFSILKIETCEKIVITQCVDNIVVPKNLLASYHFFTMFASFLLPLFSTLISYSLVACEISKMKARDQRIMGRRNSAGSIPMQKALNKTILMRTLITLSFLLCWGPYYANGIVDWLIRDISEPVDTGTVYTVSYLLMYFNCLLDPIVFGVFLKEVRQNFYKCLCCFWENKKKTERSSSCNHTMTTTSRNTNTSKLLPQISRKRSSSVSVSFMSTQRNTS